MEKKQKIYNCNRITLRGVVGSQNSGPVKIIRIDKQPVIYFTLRYYDKMWVDEKGKNQYNRKYVKVFLPPNNYGEKIFKHLYSGRLIEATGTISYYYENYTDKEGRAKTHVELRMSNVSIEFIDQPLNRQINKVIEVLESKNLISDNQINCSVDEVKKAVFDYVEELSGHVIDRTSKENEILHHNEDEEENIEEELLASGVPF